MPRSRKTERNILDMFLEDPDDEDGCWTWMGRVDRDGYGRHGRDLAYRAVYEILVGPIPQDQQLDHLCRNILCVRPDHLEPVSQQENLRRRDAARGTE